jgi:IS30 family transposase
MTEKIAPTAKREQRRLAVSGFLLAGLTVREIAREIDSSPATVQRDATYIRKQWREQCLQAVDDHIRLDLSRIDAAMKAIWNEVQDGRLAAVDRMIKLLDQRAKYLGLYAPTEYRGELNVNYF